MNRLLAFVLLASLLALPAAAQDRGIDWLVLVIDKSGSIRPDEYELQRSAYVHALPQPDIASQVRQVAVVEFSTRAEVVIDWSSPEEAAAAYAEHVRRKYGGETGIGRGIALALTLFEGKRGRRVIDVSGDGKENVDFLLLSQARDQAMHEGIEINGLALIEGGESGLVEFYEEYVTTGFVRVAASWDDFAYALLGKLRTEIAGGYSVRVASR